MSTAKDKLLKALEDIDEVEAEMDAEIRYLCVCYSVVRNEADGSTTEQGGWVHTSDPAWVIGSLLRRCADQIDNGYVSREEADE